MIIDFKEIPVANKGGGEQDRFEQFACDFLETIGFKIVRRPDRGPDGKKDLIVSDTRKGVGGETTVTWLVSCKHKAHTGIAVNDIDEEDIYDRVLKHKCNGFLGFYSTLPASTLSDKLHGLKDKIEYTTFDSTRIEKELLQSNQKDRLLVSYFPISHDKYRKQLFNDNNIENGDESKTTTALTEEDVFRMCKTAIIVLEIEKIKWEYYSSKGDKQKEALNKLYWYSDHSNERVASAIFRFLNSISDTTRGGLHSDIAGSIHSLVLTFFPSSYDTEEKERIENGKQCIYIGFGLVYDAFIYLNNFRIAMYGLSIWKFIYREGKRNGMPELAEAVLEQYRELEQTLDRPERNDLGSAKEFVKVFKDDLETWDLSFPVLPDHLCKLTLKDDKK